MMVRSRRNPRHQKFRQSQPRAKPHGFRCQPCPKRIKRLQPIKQFLVDGLGMCPSQSLIKVVMGIDKSGQNDMARSIKHLVRRCHGLPPNPNQFYNFATLKHKSAASPLTQNCQRIFEPDALHFTFSPFLG